MQQLINNVNGLLLDIIGEIQLSLGYLLEHLIVKLAIKGYLPHSELVNYAA
jgi:hypothetical protein